MNFTDYEIYCLEFILNDAIIAIERGQDRVKYDTDHPLLALLDKVGISRIDNTSTYDVEEIITILDAILS